ncbi:MAG: 50S ribosomal protein L21, partial [Bacteroidales bacterium]|nr:50S ribosomal protein L21 [Bacteroidales bacterium]
MYAIVDIAGQQFKVEAGSVLYVNRLAAKKDEAVEFDKVLLLDNEGAVKVGAPYVEGAVVKATVLKDDVKGNKVIVFK